MNKKKTQIYISNSRNSRTTRKRTGGSDKKQQNTGPRCSPYTPSNAMHSEKTQDTKGQAVLSPPSGAFFSMSKKMVNSFSPPVLPFPSYPEGLVSSFVSFPPSPPTDETAGRIYVCMCYTITQIRLLLKRFGRKISFFFFVRLPFVCCCNKCSVLRQCTSICGRHQQGKSDW